MKAVRDLGGGRGPVACALGIGARPIPRDDLHPGVLPEPLRHGARRCDPGAGPRAGGAPGPPGSCHRCAVSAGRNRPPRARVGVGNDGAGCRRSRRSRVFRLTARPQRWLRRTPALPPKATPRATRRWASRSVRRAQGAATVGSRSVKMRRAAGAIAAEPLADAQLEAHAIVRPRQIGQGACVAAVDTPRWEWRTADRARWSASSAPRG